jgi:putative phage-type endonuclease
MNDNKKEWLEQRRSGIGGSDAAAVLGLSPWKSAYTLWCEKTGRVLEPNLDELEYIEWGQVLEEPIAQKYQQVTGRVLFDPGRFAIVKHPTIPHMHCTVDRIVVDWAGQDPIRIALPDYASGLGDLSIKNVGAFRIGEWEDSAPLPYQVQLQHELAINGLSWGSFAVLIGGQKFRYLDVPRDSDFIDMLLEEEYAFWKLVVEDTPPEIDASDSSLETLKRMFPNANGKAVDLAYEFIELRDRRAELKAEIKIIEADVQAIDNKIKLAMGECTFAHLPDGSGFSFKKQDRAGYTVEPTSFRVLREVKVK